MVINPAIYLDFSTDYQNFDPNLNFLDPNLDSFLIAYKVHDVNIFKQKISDSSQDSSRLPNVEFLNKKLQENLPNQDFSKIPVEQYLQYDELADNFQILPILSSLINNTVANLNLKDGQFLNLRFLCLREELREIFYKRSVKQVSKDLEVKTIF